MAVTATTTSRSELRSAGRRRGSARFRLAWALLLLPALLGGCSSCSDSKDAGPSAAATEKLAPVPAPQGLLAELYIEKPGNTWTSLRELVGGPAKLLPAGFQMLAATLLGLPPDAAGLIDELPVRGALVLDDQGTPRLVLGLHVRNGREIVASLCTGDKARFREKRDKASGVTFLTPVPGKASTEISLGVVGHYLLAAKEQSVVKLAGPFVARTLPTKKPPPGPIVAVFDKKALSGPAASRLEAGWKAYEKQLEESSKKTQARHGRPADFADPAAALMGASSAVGSFEAVLKSTERITLVVEPLEGRLAATAELTPEKSGAAAELVDGMSVGSLDAVLQLPSGTALALVSHASEKSRSEWADSTKAALEKLFGERLHGPDKKKLEHTLSDLAKGRGDDAALGIAVGEQGSLLLRSSVSDADAFRSGARGLFQLLRAPAIARPLEQFIGKTRVQLSKTHVKGIDGNVERARVTITPPRSEDGKVRIQLGSKPIDFLWTVQDKIAFGAAAHDPAPGLLGLVHAAGDTRTSLGGEATVAAAVKRLGQDASFAVFVDPKALTAGAGGPAAPVVLGLGRSHEKAWLKADLSQAAIQSVLRFTMRRR